MPILFFLICVAIALAIALYEMKRRGIKTRGLKIALLVVSAAFVANLIIYIVAILFSIRAPSPEIKKLHVASQYLDQATKNQEKGNFNEAIADLTKAIELKPDNWSMYYKRASAYEESGNYNAAIADYTKIIEINPKDGGMYFIRAIAYYNIKNYDKAWEDIHTAEKLEPETRFRPEAIEALKKASGREK